MTDYILQTTMKDVAENANLSDYTDRVLNEDGKSVTANCAVSSQVFNTLYPRYEITWDTSSRDGYIWAIYHLESPELGVRIRRRVKIWEADEPNLIQYKLEEVLGKATLEAKQWYDDGYGPWHADYSDGNTPPEEG